MKRSDLKNLKKKLRKNQVRNKSLPFFKGQIINNVKCIDLSSQGYGVVKVDGFTIFVRSLFENEVADIRVDSVFKNYAIASVLKLIEESEFRESNFCTLSNRCNAFKYHDLSYTGQIKIKEKQMSKLFNQDVEVIKADKSTHYRNKSEFFYHNDKFNTYDHNKKLVKVSECLVSRKEINDLLPIVLEAINNNKKANIKSVIFRYSEFEDKLMLIFVSESENRYHLKIAQEIIGYSNKVKSIILNTGKSDNYLFNNDEKVLYGESYLIDTIFRKKFKITSKSFYQINQKQTENLYKTAIEFADLKPSDNVADLYCGVGTIGIIVSDYVNHVLGIEVVSDAVEAARDNINLNDISNYEVIEHDLNEDIDVLENIDVAIVDPPRNGLSKSIIDNLSLSNINKIVYVSCNPYTQKRDLDIFIEKGYKLEKITAVDMFANTEHVESVILLTKK